MLLVEKRSAGGSVGGSAGDNQHSSAAYRSTKDNSLTSEMKS